MEKNGTKAIKEFMSLVHKEFGMHIVILAAFVDRNGNPLMLLSLSGGSVGRLFVQKSRRSS